MYYAHIINYILFKDYSDIIILGMYNTKDQWNNNHNHNNLSPAINLFDDQFQYPGALAGRGYLYTIYLIYIGHLMTIHLVT